MNATGKRDFTQAEADFLVVGVGVRPATALANAPGSLSERNCRLRYQAGGRTVAVVTISRDRDSLEAELAMERNRRVD
jgi:NADPH-dependent 2,4-dienoyl-CoA reductase/sulfur reductase-like enzyme